MNDFIKAISSKEKGYKAHFIINNNTGDGTVQIGITPEYTREVLEMVIKEYESQGHKLLKIVEA